MGARSYTSTPRFVLTQQEERVLAAAIEGETLDMTARRLLMSRSWVAAQRRAITRAYGARTFLQAVAIFVRRQTAEEIIHGS